MVSPESSVSPESLVKAAERGKLIFVIAGVGDGMSSWANGVGVPAFAYPLSHVDINRLYEEMRRTIAVNLAVALALSGITIYLVDANGNAGALQYHMPLDRVNTTMIGLLRCEIAKAGKVAL